MSTKQSVGVIDHFIENSLLLRSDRFLFATSLRQRKAGEKCFNVLADADC
jgi:hypothetical protein